MAEAFFLHGVGDHVVKPQPERDETQEFLIGIGFGVFLQLLFHGDPLDQPLVLYFHLRAFVKQRIFSQCPGGAAALKQEGCSKQ